MRYLMGYRGVGRINALFSGNPELLAYRPIGIKPTIAKIMGPGGLKAVVVHNLRILDVEEIKSVPYVPLSIPSSND